MIYHEIERPDVAVLPLAICYDMSYVREDQVRPYRPWHSWTGYDMRYVGGYW
ncbi:hypothetical protein MANES_16G048670v8 [Manihot esculenta]|uniref:Uncharacterized protein n=1 Tax=Manihot esculenta TaxID=3983 RepID=A0ACB7G7W0_MANES|nr:hypothetical protein MANES_16G048670v8 [Manihot esculenta]